MRILNVEEGRYDEEARAVLSSVGEVDDVVVDSQAAFIDALRAEPYAAVLVRLGVAVDAAALAAAPSLRYVVTPTTGLDHIDLAEVAARGVEVLSLRGETAFLDTITPTAEHTWALLLAVRRRLVAAHSDATAGRWLRAPFLAEELHGACLGIVGCGRLGRMVARYGLAFGMRVLVHDVDAASLDAAPAGAERAGAEDLLAQADVVSLHLPLDDATAGWLSAARIGVMRPGAVLVNTARGELVDEPALLAALQRGHLGGAGLDVLAGDSRWEGTTPAGHPLLRFAATHDNLVVTPHVGGYGRQAVQRTGMFVARKLAAAASNPQVS